MSQHGPVNRTLLGRAELYEIEKKTISSGHDVSEHQFGTLGLQPVLCTCL